MTGPHYEKGFGPAQQAAKKKAKKRAAASR
jgi:hypothetical protein